MDCVPTHYLLQFVALSAVERILHSLSLFVDISRELIECFEKIYNERPRVMTIADTARNLGLKLRYYSSNRAKSSACITLRNLL